MNPWLIALLLLAVVLTGIAVWFARLVRSTAYSPRQTFFWLLARFLTRFLWRTEVYGSFPGGEEGNGVVICNHRSSVDPFFVQIAARRVIHWMVAKEYCEHTIFGFFLRIAEVIPVNRGGIDTASTKTAIRIVSDGGLVGMLPEGRINTTDRFMNSVRPGAIIVALKGKAPIIPCYIENAPYGGKAWTPFLMRARVRVHYGQPIDLTPFYGQERDEKVVRELLIQSVRAIADLAGREDYEPQLAGRNWKPDISEFDRNSARS